METANRDVREIIREGTLRRREILRVLEDGPLTVPEIAQAIEAPTHETMYWVMDMRKYGWIAEVPEANDDGLFSYRAIERKGA